MTSLRLLCFLFFTVTVSAVAQPILSQMEEGDRVQLHLWVCGCFQLEDNAYQFDMKDGKIICTGQVLPDYVRAEQHPWVAVEPVELSKAQIDGIDQDLIQFRKTELRYHRKASTGVTYVERSTGEKSTTTSEIKLTFIEKGKVIVEETIDCPDLAPLYGAAHPGLAALKQQLHLKVKPQLDLIRTKLSEAAHQQKPSPASQAAERAPSPAK